MLSSATRIAVAAAVLVGTPLITATIHDGALAASHIQQEIGIVIETPAPNHAYTNSPVTLTLVRPEKWHKAAESQGGQIPNPTFQAYQVEYYLQRHENGAWKFVYSLSSQVYYGNLPNDKLKVNLWSKANGGAKSMKDTPGKHQYRVRAASGYKTSFYNWTKMTDWREFSVKNLTAPAPVVKSPSSIPKMSSKTKPSKIGRLPALQRKPGLPIPSPGPRAAPALKKVAPVMKKVSPAVKAAAPALKKTAPLLKIAPATPGTVDSPTIDVPTLKMVPRQ